jgi:hypothetical protein
VRTTKHTPLITWIYTNKLWRVSRIIRLSNTKKNISLIQGVPKTPSDAFSSFHLTKSITEIHAESEVLETHSFLRIAFEASPVRLSGSLSIPETCDYCLKRG